MAKMVIEVDEHGELVLSDVFSGIGIKTDKGMFGIAQRDGGIEVLLNGVPVYPVIENHDEIMTVSCTQHDGKYIAAVAVRFAAEDKSTVIQESAASKTAAVTKAINKAVIYVNGMADRLDKEDPVCKEDCTPELTLNVNVLFRQDEEGTKVRIDNIENLDLMQPEIFFNHWHRLTLNGEAVKLNMVCKDCLCKDCLQPTDCEVDCALHCSRTKAVTTCVGFQQDPAKLPEACRSCLCRRCGAELPCKDKCTINNPEGQYCLQSVTATENCTDFKKK